MISVNHIITEGYQTLLTWTVLINPLDPNTAHCAEKIVTARWCTGSASAERVGQGEVSGVTHRMLCTWQLLGLAVKATWLAPGWLILALAA